MAWMASTTALLSYPLSAMTALTSDPAGTPARSALAWLTSACWPGDNSRTTGSSRPLTATWTLVPKPPRLRPRDWASCPPEDLRAPAAWGWARTTGESRTSHSRFGSWKSPKSLCHMPLRAQRSKGRQMVFHLPKYSGRSRHGAPVLAIHRMASMKRRLSLAGAPRATARAGRRSLIRSQSSSRMAWRGGMGSSGKWLSVYCLLNYSGHPRICPHDLILGLEMSRFARSCKDWYQLLEVCAVFSTLLADQD